MEFNQPIAKSRALLKAAQLSPENKIRLIEQTVDLADKLTINPGSETFQQTEDKIYLLIELTEELIQLGNITKAQTIYKRIGKALNGMEQSWQRKHEGNLALPEGVRGERWGDSWELEQNVEKARFWQQDFESRLKTKMVIGLQQVGRTEEAGALLQEITDSFRKDVHGRRDRFDIKSMIESAKLVVNTDGMTDEGAVLFNLAIAKLELLRGDENVFNEAVSFFSKSVRGSQIPDQEKDKLLSQLIIKLTPDKKGDWREMFESIPGLVKTAKAITDNKKYPQAELEALRVFNGLIADIEFNHGDSWGNRGKMVALRELFRYIAKDNPGILMGSNFEALLQISQAPEYLKNLSVLLPAEAEQFYQGDIAKDGVFDLTKIRAGFYDKASVYELTQTELERVLSSPELTKERLGHLMQVYSELIKQELSSFYGTETKDTKIKLDDLLNLKCIHNLHQLIDSRVHAPKIEFSEADKKILETLLRAETSDESNGKYALYENIIGAPKTHILAQRIAFENLIKSGRISDYAASYFGDVIISADNETQKTFFNWIKTFLKTEKGHLPDDRILSYLFNHPDQAEDFFKRYHASHKLDTVPEKIDEKMHFGDELGYFFKGNKEQFFALRDSFLEKKKFWLPDLFNETDLLLTYEKRFSWFMSFDQFIEGIRHIYINGSFDPTSPYDLKYTYTPQQLEAAIRRVNPAFQFNEEQIDTIRQTFRVNKNAYELRDYQGARAIPDTRGQISYNQLTSYVIPNLKLSEQQRDDLIIFLNGPQDNNEYFTLLRTFGRDNLTAEQQSSLNLLFDSARKDYDNRQEKIRNAKVETPAVFKKMPEVVQFMMTRFFAQLRYGEREAILKEFDKSAELLTPQRAIKRFFELSSTEKVGQFLSTRRDLIPDDYRKELEQFQEDVESSAFDEICRTVESELGKPIEQLFSAIEPRPLKVGTIGEVYRVALLDGREAVVKVITPSKRRAVKRMLDRLEHVCRDLERNKERFPGSYDPMSMFNEFKKSMEEELDFTYEYRNAENIRINLPEKVSIPGYEPSLCTKSILTQLYAQGVHIRELTSEKTKQEVIDTLGNMLINQFINTGVFLDDLHPGNIRVIPLTGEIELLDFGRTGYTNEAERSSLIPLLMAIKTKSVKDVVNILHIVSPEPNGFDRVGLEEALEKIMKEENMKTSMIISRVFFECSNHGLAVNPVYLRMLKGVMTFEGTAMQLNPNFNFESFI